MPVKLVPSAWVSTSAYAVGAIVEYNGVRFRAADTVSANSAGNAIPVDNTDWTFDGVIRIEDYYSLQYAIEEELNDENEIVINMIPLYIQNVERKLSKVLRSPAQKIIREFTIQEGSKFPIPQGWLALISLRNKDAEGGGYTLESNGAIKIKGVSNQQTFERVRQYGETGDRRTRRYQDEVQVDYPVFFKDESHFYIAPDLAAGTTVEMFYYREEPELGVTGTITNNMDEPINADGMTLAQWEAAGNSPDNFIPDTHLVLSNLWTATVPYLLKYGALIEAYGYINDMHRLENARKNYDELMEMTMLEFQKADMSGGQTQIQHI